ncbi:hypothetical protein BDR03DRAFT_314581 [Suillus americanus]|nr:hypothetical protein BDR03DRAFT_314581 [Suillus americanus]
MQLSDYFVPKISRGLFIHFSFLFRLGALNPSELDVERDDYKLCRSCYSRMHGRCGGQGISKALILFQVSCSETHGKFVISSSSAPARWRN